MSKYGNEIEITELFDERNASNKDEIDKSRYGKFGGRCRRLGMFYEEIGDYIEAEKYLNAALNILVKLDKTEDEFIISDTGKALECNIKALNIGIKLYGEKNYEVKALYHSLETIYQKIGYSKEGLEYYEKSINILTQLDGYEQLSMAYNNIVTVYIDMKDYL